MKGPGFLASVVALALASAGAQVSVVHVFPGQDGPNPPDAPTPSADMMGGVSRKHLVGFINGGFSVRSKADGKEIQPGQTLYQFWEAAFKNAGRELPGPPYDPRILFDTSSSRWFAICDAWGPLEGPPAGRSGPSRYMLFAVSSDDDPTHPWKAVAYEAPGNVDNIKLGVDKNGVYSAAYYQGKTQAITAAVAIPKSDLLWQGKGTPTLAHLNWLELEGTERMADHKLPGVEGMFPALDLGPDKKPNDPVIYVNRYRTEVDGETIIQIRSLVWTSPTTARIGQPTNVGLGTHYPVQPTTRGVQPPLAEGLFSPGLAAGEGRIVNAVVRNGRVWAVAATQVENRIGAFWVEIDLHAMKLVQHGTLSDPDADILFPSLSVDAHGNLGMAMSRTSATQGISTYVTGRLRNDPPGKLRPLVKAVEGRYVYVTRKNDPTKQGQFAGTSDYATTVMDPSDPLLFWSYQLAATNDCMPQERNGGKFGTHWVGFRVER